MKSLAALLILAALIFFITQSPPQPKTTPQSPTKSTRLPSSPRSKTNPFQSLQVSSQNLTDQQLRAAIKTEWSKLNNRPNNRDLPILVSHLRELGRRESLDGLLILRELLSSGNPTDKQQANIAIIAGWGIADHEAAATFLYTNINVLNEQGTTWLTSPNILNKTLELAEYEIQARWTLEDPEGFLTMLNQADSGFPVNPARREKVHQRFPQLPNPDREAADADPFGTSPDAVAGGGIKPRPGTRYFSNFGGERSASPIEWAARNLDLARQLIERTRSDPYTPTSLIYAHDFPKIIGGLSLRNSDYQALVDLAPPSQRLEAIRQIIVLTGTHHTQEAWPVDGRPAPTQLSQSERTDAIKSVILSEPTLTEDDRRDYLEVLQTTGADSQPEK